MKKEQYTWTRKALGKVGCEAGSDMASNKIQRFLDFSLACDGFRYHAVEEKTKETETSWFHEILDERQEIDESFTLERSWFEDSPPNKHLIIEIHNGKLVIMYYKGFKRFKIEKNIDGNDSVEFAIKSNYLKDALDIGETWKCKMVGMILSMQNSNNHAGIMTLDV